MKRTVTFIILLTVSSLLIELAKSNNTDDDSGRIVNGHDVPEGKYPFIVSLQESNSPCSSRGEHFCGGSLINDNTILTAAHCFKNMNAKKVSVLVGIYHLDKTSGECYRVAKLVPHPEYVDNNVIESPDLGVIKLEKAIVFKKSNKNIGKICLPQLKENAVNNNCTIMGWGQTSKGKESRHLQEIVVTAERTKLNKNKKEMHYVIDFKDSKASACFGDSGSPMVCPVRGDKGSLVQFGVDSFVDKKTCNGITVYTNVALYIDWIREQAED